MLEKNKATNNICHLRQLGETLSSGGQVSNCETAAEMNRALLKKKTMTVMTAEACSDLINLTQAAHQPPLTSLMLKKSRCCTTDRQAVCYMC